MKNQPAPKLASLAALSGMGILAASALIGGLLICDMAAARETPRVLPNGIFRARLVGALTAPIEDTYNEEGKLQGLSQGLNRTVTISDLAANADANTRAQLNTLVNSLNTIQAGLGSQLAASQLNSELSVQQQITLVALERGVSDRLSLGVRVPIINRSFKNRFRADATNNAAAVNAQLGALSPAVTGGLAGIANQQLDSKFFENALFTSKGYKAPQDFDKTQLGDVEFGGKYNFFKNEYLYSSFLIGFAAPTGAKPELTNPFDKGNGRGAWSYAVQGLQEVYPVRQVTLGAAAKLSYSLKDTSARAVPKNETDSLPSLLAKDGQVQDVTRQRGLQLETEVSAGYKFPGDVFGLWTAYQYSSKTKDTFSGNGNLYYAGLEKGTDWTAHSAEVGAEFSTIPAYRKKQFSIPMDVSLFFNRTLRGTNTPLVSYTRLDLMVYF